VKQNPISILEPRSGGMLFISNKVEYTSYRCEIFHDMNIILIPVLIVYTAIYLGVCITPTGF
jgi:hypothetical protein